MCSPKQPRWKLVWVRPDPTTSALKKETCFSANRRGRKSPILVLFVRHLPVACWQTSRMLRSHRYGDGDAWSRRQGQPVKSGRPLRSGPQWTCSRLGNTSKLVSPNTAEGVERLAACREDESQHDFLIHSWISWLWSCVLLLYSPIL